MDKKKIWLEAIKGINAIMITLPMLDELYQAAVYGYYAGTIIAPFFRKGNWLIVFLFLIVYAVFGRLYDAFSISRNRVPEMVYSQGLSALLSDFFMYLVIVLLAKKLVSPLMLIIALLVQILFAFGWSALAQKFYFLIYPAKKTAVIYDMRRDLPEQIRSSWLNREFDIQLNIGIEECLADLDVLAGMQTAFLSGVHSHDRNIILKYCVERNIEAFVIPRIGDEIMNSAQLMNMLHLPILRVARYSPSSLYLIAKRVFDILASGLALVL